MGVRTGMAAFHVAAHGNPTTVHRIYGYMRGFGIIQHGDLTAAVGIGSAVKLTGLSLGVGHGRGRSRTGNIYAIGIVCAGIVGVNVKFTGAGKAYLAAAVHVQRVNGLRINGGFIRINCKDFSVEVKGNVLIVPDNDWLVGCDVFQ